MFIVKVKDGQKLELALKEMKTKFKQAGIVNELREREYYTKPSEKRRKIISKAKYRDKIRNKLLGDNN